MNATIEFLTEHYRFSHGHAPRGRGGWAFGLSKNATGDNIFWCEGTYGEAKKAARAHFAERLNMANPLLPSAAVYVLP